MELVKLSNVSTVGRPCFASIKECRQHSRSVDCDLGSQMDAMVVPQTSREHSECSTRLSQSSGNLIINVCNVREDTAEVAEPIHCFESRATCCNDREVRAVILSAVCSRTSVFFRLTVSPKRREASAKRSRSLCALSCVCAISAQSSALSRSRIIAEKTLVRA